jgi:hypothetical protein
VLVPVPRTGTGTTGDIIGDDSGTYLVQRSPALLWAEAVVLNGEPCSRLHSLEEFAGSQTR